MRTPPGVSSTDFTAAIERFTEVIGAESVFTSDEDVDLYRDAYSPLWGEPEERVASAAVAPTSVEQVQAIVRIANQYKIPLYAISTGKNLGYGGSAPNYSGSVVVDLKRMNRIIEVDDRRNFCIVEPGVAYVDLYRHVEEKDLKVIVDVPDPGWGSVVGNALEHGVGYMMGSFRDHFGAHCGMEVVLPNGEIMRTGMGALPGAQTWGEYKYGFGPLVDGLFSQANFGIVTKMGFWMYPRPEAFFSGLVTVPRQADIIPLTEIINHLEDSGLIGHPRYGSPLAPSTTPRDPALTALFQKPGGASTQELEGYAQQRNLGFFNCVLNFYGPAKGITANWEYAKEKLSAIPGVRFEDLESYRFPLSAEQKKTLRHKVALGIPNMSIFSLGARTELNPSPADGHLWFSPVIPRTGEALIEAQQVFGEVFREMGLPSPIFPFSTPRTWIYRAFVFIMSFSISRSDVEHNKKTRALFQRLVQVGAEHGWGEYRTAPAFQDLVASTCSFNNHALLRFNETLKDAIDPNGIISPGRGGIWPRHLRNTAR